jgi:uncharacterized protein YbjT (DUF2867 family)
MVPSDRAGCPARHGYSRARAVDLPGHLPAMILLTGATGLVGSAVLERLVATGEEQVRAYVRDPRSLGETRVKVQIALGDLADPRSMRNALRGVDTVVHLAATIRDQPRATIEEINAIGTWRLVRAAERAGVRRFVFFSAIGASDLSPVRFMRSKALAEEAVAGMEAETITFAPSIVYAPNDPYLRLLERMSLLPVMPIAGEGQAAFQPIWAEDVADAVTSVLGDGHDGRGHYELAGPDVLTHEQIVRLALRSFGRRRRITHVPPTAVRAGLRGLEEILGPAAFATWEEARLMDVPMVAARGTADAESLGVRPRPMRAVLGAG